MKLVNIHKLTIILAFVSLLGNLSFAQDWSLQQCLDVAETHNTNLQIAGNNITLSSQREKEAKANLLPKIMLNADYKYFTNLPYQLMPLSTFNPTAPEGQFKEAQFGVPHNINANLQFALPIYNPQIYGGIQASKIATKVSELSYQKNEEQIYFEITNLYYNAQILHAQIEFLNGNLANNEILLANLRILQNQLLVTGMDVEKMQLQVAQLISKKSSLESKLEQLINALKFVIGIPNAQSFSIDHEIVSYENTDYPTEKAVDLRLSHLRGSLLGIELKTLNNSRFLPTINLVGSFGMTGFGYDEEPNSFLNFYPLGFAGLQLSYPLFNGTSTGRRIAQKRIELTNNELKSEFVDDQNTMLIVNAKLERNSTNQTRETSLQHIELAQNIYNNTLLQQEQGLASITEVLLADNALREAQQSNLTAIVDYLKADLELKRLTGNITRQ